jgi:dTDP-4-dehydrorhamnose 3,5-epimerase
MVITETKLKGAFVIDPELFEDVRGFFARTWSNREFEAFGLNPSFVESNVSFNKKKATLRGMHYQLPPYGQTKLVRCTRGSIYDVVIDLRPDSSTFKQWFALELSADNHRMLYVPGEFAHGFQTLEDNTEVLYLTSSYYAPEHAGGVRWNDPAFNISWPTDPLVIIPRDRDYQDFAA